jgi:hypothetical protein
VSSRRGPPDRLDASGEGFFCFTGCRPGAYRRRTSICSSLAQGTEMPTRRRLRLGLRPTLGSCARSVPVGVVAPYEYKDRRTRMRPLPCAGFWAAGMRVATSAFHSQERAVSLPVSSRGGNRLCRRGSACRITTSTRRCAHCEVWLNGTNAGLRAPDEQPSRIDCAERKACDERPHVGQFRNG